MLDRELSILPITIQDNLCSLSQANLRIAHISQDERMATYHAGYQAALEDVARLYGLSIAFNRIQPAGGLVSCQSAKFEELGG